MPTEQRFKGWPPAPPTPAGLRQWRTVKTMTDKLDATLAQIADGDCQVEQAVHMGGRDWLVCYSRPVLR